PRGTPCGFLIPKYVNTGSHVNKNFVRGYRFDGDGSQELYAHAFGLAGFGSDWRRSEEHTSELQSRFDLVCRLLLEKKKKKSYEPSLLSQSTLHCNGLSLPPM